jgi:hypothetical protein
VGCVKLVVAWKGWKKVNPIDPMPMGAIRKEVLLSESVYLPHELINANPMPIKKPPLTSPATKANGGKLRAIA